MPFSACFSPFFCGSTSEKVRQMFSVFIFLKMDFFNSYVNETLTGCKILGWKWLLLKSLHNCLPKFNVAVENLMSFLFWLPFRWRDLLHHRQLSLSVWGTFRIFSLTPMSCVMLYLTVGLVLFTFLATYWVGKTLMVFGSLISKEERKDSIRKVFRK